MALVTLIALVFPELYEKQMLIHVAKYEVDYVMKTRRRPIQSGKYF